MVQNNLAVNNRIESFINGSFLIETKQLTQLLQWFEQCHNYRRFGLVIGSQGTGKTKAIEYCVSQFIQAPGLAQDFPSSAHYIQCTSSCTSTVLRQLILDSVSSSLNYEDKLHSAKLKGWSLIEVLQVRSLTIDNAHLMTNQALVDIVMFSKTTKLALILVGSIKLIKTLKKLDLLDYFRHKFEFKNLELEEMVQVVHVLNDFLNSPETSELISFEVMTNLYELSEGNFDMLIECLLRVICKPINGEAL
ncbi:ATP-binding protein [Leptolyngbya ohadii]|uniref:ATP-binding protein n=1 Tax=Leptolyngbya ohadii TaxID=1962290 RepID=UPI0015C5BA55|nr:ATP-binding protein [Leptolyngbya ohadii]